MLFYQVIITSLQNLKPGHGPEPAVAVDMSELIKIGWGITMQVDNPGTTKSKESVQVLFLQFLMSTLLMKLLR